MTPVQLVQGQLDAYNARDIDTFCTFFADSIEVYDGLTQEMLFTGMEAFRARYTKTFSNPNLHCHLLNRIEQDQVVIDHEEVTGMSEDVVYAIAVYQISENIIQKVTFY